MINKILIFVFLIVDRVNGKSLIANQKHLCLKTETYQKVAFVDKISPQFTIETSWCWNVSKGFRCRSPKKFYKREKVPQTVNMTRSVLACCKGFIEIDSKCIPYCSDKCVNGLCTDPDTCDCDSGFHGPSCDKICPPNKWGRKCLEQCDCLNDGQCDRFNGRCFCLPGWQGPRCESICFEGYYGPNCQEKCDCYNDACNHVTGTCLNAATENAFSNVNVVQSLLQPEIAATNLISNTSRSDAINIVSNDTPLMQSKESTWAPTSSSPMTVSSTVTKYSESLIGTQNLEKAATTTTSTTSTLETGVSPESQDLSRTTVNFIQNAQTSVGIETDSNSFQETTEAYTESMSPKQKTLSEKVLDTISPITEDDKVPNDDRRTSHAKNLSSFLSTSTEQTKPFKNGISTTELTTETKDINQNPRSSDRNVTLNKHDNQTKANNSYLKNETNFSENFETILRPFNAPRFVPSLSVLTGVSILIIIIGAWWIAVQKKRKNNKILAKKQEDIFISKEKHKFQDGFVQGFLENSVYHCEMVTTEDRPVLQTFKPLPN